MGHWTPEDIPWREFRKDALTPELLTVIKTAAMVERNAEDYVRYLYNVFVGDDEFRAAAGNWGAEEVQHGDVLGRYAGMADPAYDFMAAFARYREGYKLPVDATTSVRGSRTGELVARCIVEVGTSSFYTAIHDGTGEPVLKAICRRIAADEYRHYTLFLTHLRRYVGREGVGRAKRLWIAVSRVLETDDDELAYAYHSGNSLPGPYDRKVANAAYIARAAAYYRKPHIDRAARMLLKAVGMETQGPLARLFEALAWRHVRSKAKAK